MVATAAQVLLTLGAISETITSAYISRHEPSPNKYGKKRQPHFRRWMRRYSRLEQHDFLGWYLLSNPEGVPWSDNGCKNATYFSLTPTQIGSRISFPRSVTELSLSYEAATSHRQHI